ncbi:cation:H+ antiporter [Anaerosolibacter carboniphilus]|uniref:Cation:H+ antiporter n=1 Tax=Anaerosolibacter carboniphilus TaxID=1417629 RepID=A0A841KXG0_9FIRM|nr:calcium/sodium antiporter [Anaerosolibacter carboniphilus]MBB6214869.1 cation:H+ antiporter [Anaerosolibacter carboniphilus]
MENIIVFVLFFIGLFIIIKAGDLFVDAAVWIAKITGVPNILIGATLVSLATTLPELFVSMIATLDGHLDMAMGNAIGSTICNVGLILGLCAMISPISIRRRFFSVKGILMICATVILYLMAFNRQISRNEGFVLLILLIIYIIINIFEVYTRKEDKYTIRYQEKNFNTALLKNLFKFITGAGGIILGARLLVDNGVLIANILNIPEQVISLTLIALGTSLPELSTSLIAVIKGYEGISVGNIIGANILNLTMVLGASSIAAEDGLIISVRNFEVLGKKMVAIPQTLVLDIPFSALLMMILIIAGTVNRKLGRQDGVLLMLLYIAYLTVLALISF